MRQVNKDTPSAAAHDATREGERAAQAVPAIILGVSSWHADRNRDERKAISSSFGLSRNKSTLLIITHTHMECAAQSTFS
jgi:hypothetical protein